MEKLTLEQMRWHNAMSNLIADVTLYATSAEYHATQKATPERTARRHAALEKQREAENRLVEWVIAHPYPAAPKAPGINADELTELLR